ncbi:NTP transferase domain-containing protein [Rhizobium sp. 18055]|uniref:nucleotidyltransferase family protein n=1 Tax=Rhizobium sp. 18055 TaxID=2681403 RepID=UPI001358EAAC|nr:nucleotidyltransferase family protein [Rhizobium sp. 18055]
MEIETRPRPCGAPNNGATVACVILAAGRASRMGEGGPHKLLAEFDGVPLIRRCALAALASGVAAVAVVTGYRRSDIEAALEGLHLACVHNEHYASGMASSLIAGFSAEPAIHADGIMVMLADMPAVSTADLDALLAAFRQSGGEAIVRAVCGGKRGNPVILPRALYGAVRRLEGDVGARYVIEESGMPVVGVDIGVGAHLDVDTPDAVIAAGGILKG